MALKWNDLLDSIVGGINATYAKSAGKTKNKDDVSGLSNATKELNNLQEATVRLMDASKKASIKLLDEEKVLQRLPRGTAAYTAQLRKVEVLEARRKNLGSLLEANEKNLQAAEQERIQEEAVLDGQLNKTTANIKRISGGFEDVEASYQASLKKLVAEGNDTEDALNQLKFDKLINNINAGLFNTKTDDLLKKGGEQMGSIVSSTLSKVLPGPLADIIASAVIGAFNQALELNTALTNLQRSMGGVVSASQLGFDALGNSSSGMSSLASQALAANVSVGQFGDAIKSLGPRFGQTIGMTADLGKSQKDLAKFGIAAAQAQKLYGANIGPSVAKLSQNFGKSIGEATDVMMKGSEAAKALGLNVGEFAKNFEAVADMAGAVYFRSTEAMTQMAMIATQLGTSVAAIAGAIPKMKGINDLFKEQQKLSALGMSTTAQSLGRIYALQKSGRIDEAAKLSLASQAKDLQQQGLVDDKGGVSQQGIDTLSAAGMGKEQIEALQKMSLQAQRTGLSFDQLGGQVELTKEQQRKLDKDTQNNVSISEQAGQIVGGLKQSLIDPIAELIGPLMKSLMNAIQPFAKALGSTIRVIMDIFDPLVGFITELGNQLSLMFQDVWNPIAKLFENFGSAFGGLTDTLKKMGSFFAAVLMVPFRILSKIIGGVISVFAKIYGVIAQKLAPIFEKVSGLFEGGGTMIEDALGYITDAFDWLGDIIGSAFGVYMDLIIGAYTMLYDAIMFVLKPFIWLGGILIDVVVGAFHLLVGIVNLIIDAFKWLGDLIGSVLNPVIDSIVGAFNWVIDIITDFLSIFQPVIDLFTYLSDAISGFWNALSNHWLVKKIFGSEEKTEEEGATPYDFSQGGFAGDAVVETPAIPNAGATVDFGSNDQAAEAKRLDMEANQQFSNTSKVNTTTNITVDGVFSDKQSIKSPN